VACAPASVSGLSLISQSRDVYAVAEFIPFFEPPNPVDEESQSAPDFGNFSALVTAEVFDPFLGHADAEGSQNSSIEEPEPGVSLRTTMGTTYASASNNVVTTDMGARGDSNHSLTFELTEEADYALRAVLSVNEFSQTDIP
jgi:hypothetical protein